MAVALSLFALPAPRAAAQTAAPDIVGLSRPVAGQMQLVFHGKNGPFRIQTRNSGGADAPWFDVTAAKVSEIQTGVFMALLPLVPQDDLGFYRVVNENETIAELKGWTYLVQVSAPANQSHFVVGERPVITVTILDNFAQGITRASFGTLNLYLYGPQDPLLTTSASKLLNANTDRTKTPHHYIDLRNNADVVVKDNVLTYTLKPITDEAAGTYTAAVYAVRGDDLVQQMMKFQDLQIGTATAESLVVSDAKCAACHQGTVSGKMYMHHVDVGRSPVGSWALDYSPEKSCKACHNNDGYAAFTDASAPGGRRPDHIVIRAHGVHMGDLLKSNFNTNSATGNFRDYLGVAFPADVRNCTTCHVDDRWKKVPTQLACGTCHDNIWFGDESVKPAGMVEHSGGPQPDRNCAFCHKADTDSVSPSIATSHHVSPPKIDVVDIALTPPANGTHYVAGEAPVVTLVFKDDAGNPIDHTKVTDANFSTASLFVYGPRARAVPVLTSAAKNLNSKLRASVSSSVAGPWNINGKVFKLAINGSAPVEVPIVGAAAAVTAAEVVAALNPVITNLNGGALASVSGTAVNIRTLVQGEKGARIEIYNGDVTTAMGWKRAPNTVMEPDVTIAAQSTPANDLRALSNALDYSDPMVTRTAANIAYQLTDVAGLPAGTYNIYAYWIPVKGKITTITNATGIGHLTFQVGTKTPEKLVATRCADCHADTIFHFSSGPIHAEPFETDWCNACHDYGHTAPGEFFKNQGGTSLNGWSGFGAMPIVRRVHGVHRAHYLEHSEEIYANATKATFGEIIFPQDIRNCTKCHAESDSWKQKPARLACLACHDSDEAKAHGRLMTFMPDPNDPYGPLSVETCTICHGPGTELSPDKVHSISNPYVPPYPREGEE